MTEVARKIENIRALLQKHSLGGVRFKGVDWFSWATGGGSSVVIFTSEIGVAEVFITEKNAWVLTSTIEAQRLSDEEVTTDFEIMSFPWQKPDAADEFVKTQLQDSDCASDRPVDFEKPLPWDFQIAKSSLMPEEIQRYRRVGASAAEAMTEALSLAEPDWSERQLAGAGAQALWSRGLDPTLVLVGSHRRTSLYRHSVAKDDRLGDSAMMVFCARRYGLYANLTRFIYFREPTETEWRSFDTVAQVETEVLQETVPGRTLSSLYQVLAGAYKKHGCPDEINHHHQGGTTGYLSREHVATPGSDAKYQIQNHMAVAWNPSRPGAKIEDTILIDSTASAGREVLTFDPKWPTFEMGGLRRPQIEVKK
jgi:Xaa-Pro aminopeptidase